LNKKKLFLFLATTFILKLIFAYVFPVFADEAYYYLWSLKPQLSYFDHPAMVSWMIYLGRNFFGETGPLALRSFFILASTLTLIIWILILKKKNFSNDSLFVFLILVCLNPLLGIGSVVATPDVPLVLFWSLSYFSYLHIFENTHNLRKALSYIALGAFLGLGFCSKYHVVLFVFAGILHLIFSKNYKKLWLPGIFLTILIGALFSLPVLIWNQQNDWASFTYQLKHGFGKKYYDWTWTANFFLGQALLMSPFVFYSLFQKRNSDKTDQIFSLTQIGFFTTSSFKAIVEANWPITSHTHATAHYSQNFSRKTFKATLIYWLVIYLVLIIFINSDLSKKTLRNQYRSSQLAELLEVVKKYKPLYGPSYQISSLLSWQSNQFIPKLNGLSRYDFYDTLPESNPTEKEIFVLKHFDSIWPEKYDRYTKTRIESFEKLQIELYQLSYE
jgi:4-amino-4-deoxy-L-arabinose transferase-like glycosyltransferase